MDVKDIAVGSWNLMYVQIQSMAFLHTGGIKRRIPRMACNALLIFTTILFALRVIGIITSHAKVLN